MAITKIDNPNTVQPTRINSVYDFYKHANDFSGNQIFTVNNFLLNQDHHSIYGILKQLENKGGAIWLSNNGDICFRQSIYENIKKLRISSAKVLLSHFMKSRVNITTGDFPKNKMNPFIGDTILIHSLSLVEKEVFLPSIFHEFFTDNGILHRNKFLPSYYMLLNQISTIKLEESTTLQYIFHLANYNKNKFYLIMNWLANFFKDVSRPSPNNLILLGESKSGINIFYEDIIVPLFGNNNCVRITDNILKKTRLHKLIKEKIIYSLDNVSNVSLENKATRLDIEDLVKRQTQYDPESTNDAPYLGQTLIITKDSCLSYIDEDMKNYLVIKIPSQITEMYNNWRPVQNQISGHLLEDSSCISCLKALIQRDIGNFACLLKGYEINSTVSLQKDDRGFIKIALEDKIKKFHHILKNISTPESISNFDKIKAQNKEFFTELKKDFNSNKIKQKNVIKCFILLYPEENISSSRILMTKLRTLDKKFYSVDSLHIGAGGIKYFNLPSS